MAKAERNAGVDETVSARALMSRAAPLVSLAHDGTNPQRSTRSSRRSRCTTAQTRSVGATFHVGASSSSGGSSTSK